MTDPTRSQPSERAHEEPAPLAGVTVLAVLVDEASRTQVEIVALELGDRLLLARTVDEALALATREPIDLALIDVGIDGGAALALVHHVPALSPGARVVVAAQRADVARGADAIAVGAESLHLLPLSGDTVSSAIGIARARIQETRERRMLAEELTALRRRSDHRDLVLRLARRGSSTEALQALADGLVARGAARGAAIYLADAASDATASAPVTRRVAASGSLAEAPATAPSLADLPDIPGNRDRLSAIRVEGAEVGKLLTQGVSDETSVTESLELAAVVLGLARTSAALATTVETHDGAHLFSTAYLADAGPREVERARRHGRRLSAIVVRGAQPRDHARALLTRVRSSDLLAELSPSELVLLLPETSAFGAHACRKRLCDELALGGKLGVGVATFPHDGDELSTLLQAARERSRADLASVVHAKDLAHSPLGELVDTLTRRPLAGQSGDLATTAPLDLAVSALVTLVDYACREAKRGGHATFLATDHPGKGLGGIARALMTGAPSASAAPASGPARPEPRVERRARTTTRGAVELRDVRHLPGCADVLAMVVRAEHGVWVTCGRLDRDRYVGVHARDPRLADLLSDRLERGHRPTREEGVQ